MNKNLRFGCVVSLALAFAAQLACDSTEDPGMSCTTVAECPSGQSCNSGVCSAPVSAAAGNANASAGSAAGGSPVSGAGGSSSGGSGTPSAGSVSTSGGGGVVGTGGVVGVAGSQAQAGTNTSGGTPGSGGTSSSGGMSGVGGMGGTPEPPVTVGQCKDDFLPAASNGSVTRYDFAQGTALPACTYVITHKGAGRDGDWDTVEGISTGDGGYFGAMNTTDYAQGATCGACVEASYNGKKVVLTIVDECPLSSNPVCTKGHIDLSRKAIRQLEPNGSQENLKNVSWKYVKCPAAGNAKARLHPNQNPDWQPVVIENGLYPLKSVTLNGVNATRAGNSSGGNAWVASGTKAPYTVHAVDVNSNAITFSYTASDPNLTDTGLQFKCQ